MNSADFVESARNGALEQENKAMKGFIGALTKVIAVETGLLVFAIIVITAGCTSCN